MVNLLFHIHSTHQNHCIQWRCEDHHWQPAWSHDTAQNLSMQMTRLITLPIIAYIKSYMRIWAHITSPHWLADNEQKNCRFWKGCHRHGPISYTKICSTFHLVQPTSVENESHSSEYHTWIMHPWQEHCLLPAACHKACWVLVTPLVEWGICCPVGSAVLAFVSPPPQTLEPSSGLPLQTGDCHKKLKKRDPIISCSHLLSVTHSA